MENAGGKGLSLFVGREQDIWPGKKWGYWRGGGQGPGLGRAVLLLQCPSSWEEVSPATMQKSPSPSLLFLDVPCGISGTLDLMLGHYFGSMNCLTSLAPTYPFCVTFLCIP